MHPSIAQSNQQIGISISSGWKWGFFGMLFISILLSAIVLFQLLYQSTLLLPSGEGKPYSISRSGASSEYLKDLTYDWMGWWGNITPDNISYIEERLMKMVDSNGYGEVKAQLNDTRQRVKAHQISTVWQPRDMDVDAKNYRVVATGSMRTYLGSTMTSDVPKKFQVTYRINPQGRAYVHSFKEIDSGK
jgi:type IV conjugative transfer system protein TraE